MLFLTKLYQVVQSWPPIAANTRLDICFLPVLAFYYSAHVCCAVERGVACCSTHHTAIATLTLPCTRLVTHQSTQQPHKLIDSLTLEGLVELQGIPKP